jgi:D-alanine transaminase
VTRTAYVNGRFVPLARARVPVEDRGLQFADGVYEVVKVVRGRAVDLERHLDRLERSLAELRIGPPVSRAALKTIIAELLRRNRLTDATVYLQVDRGVAPRNHLFPARARPSLIATVRRLSLPKPAELERGVAVVTLPDQRWARCDIKSVNLLPNAMAKQLAVDANAWEAVFVRDGTITEGTSSNCFAVIAGQLRTHPATHAILRGVTRDVTIAAARTAGIDVVERAFTVAELETADEAFLTSTTNDVMPIVRIDGRTIGNGEPGAVTRRLSAAVQAALYR